MKNIKDLKYCINSKNYFKGIPFLKKLISVSFFKEDKKIAELIRNKNEFYINFNDTQKFKLSLEDKYGQKYQVNDLQKKVTWSYLNPNKNFSLFPKEPDYLFKSPTTTVKINYKSNSTIYSIEKNIIGRIEYKNIYFVNGAFRIDVFDENYEKILVCACCIKLIDYHILKTYLTND